MPHAQRECEAIERLPEGHARRASYSFPFLLRQRKNPIMSEITITPRFGDFGDRKHILDIGPNYPRFDTKEESDSGSIVNGGPGIPVIRGEGKR